MPGSHARYLRREMPSDISYSKLLCMRLALAKLSNISHVCKNLESFLQLLILLFPFRFELQILFHHSSHAQCNGLHYGTLSQYVWLKNIHRKCKKKGKNVAETSNVKTPEGISILRKDQTTFQTLGGKACLVSAAIDKDNFNELHLGTDPETAI